jgi:SAM-dependent methyltransferase
MNAGNNTKNYYSNLNKDYLKCWSSLAKQDIDNFERAQVNNWLEKFVSTKEQPLKILELGVGPGRIAKEILMHNIEYYGADISNEMIESFKGRIGENVKIKQLVVSDISSENPFENIKFDCIVAMRMLYYSKNWPAIIEKLGQKLENNGTIIFCMPNKNSTAILGKLLKSDIVGYYTFEKELRGYLKKSGFDKIKIIGYARVPDVVYDVCTNKIFSLILIYFEKITRLFLGNNFASRMLYVTASRQSVNK